MSDLPPPDGAPVDEPIVEETEVVTDDTVYAADPPSTIGEGYPIGVHVGAVGTVWIGEHEYVVDPDTGCITGQA